MVDATSLCKCLLLLTGIGCDGLAVVVVNMLVALQKATINTFSSEKAGIDAMSQCSVVYQEKLQNTVVT